MTPKHRTKLNRDTNKGIQVCDQRDRKERKNVSTNSIEQKLKVYRHVLIDDSSEFMVSHSTWRLTAV
jgi:hypothetical protein